MEKNTNSYDELRRILENQFRTVLKKVKEGDIEKQNLQETIEERKIHLNMGIDGQLNYLGIPTDGLSDKDKRERIIELRKIHADTDIGEQLDELYYEGEDIFSAEKQVEVIEEELRETVDNTVSIVHKHQDKIKKEIETRRQRIEELKRDNERRGDSRNSNEIDMIELEIGNLEYRNLIVKDFLEKYGSIEAMRELIEREEKEAEERVIRDWLYDDPEKTSVSEPTKPKPTEPKPTEPKPTEPKPTEPKPTESKPTEPKPTEPKPTEPKPTEPKPTEPKPTEPKPTEPKPTEPKPTADPKGKLPDEPEEQEADVKVYSIKAKGKKYTIQYQVKQNGIYEELQKEEYKKPNIFRRLQQKINTVAKRKYYGLRFSEALRAATRADSNILAILNKEIKSDPTLEQSRARYLKYVAGREADCFEIAYDKKHKRHEKALKKGHESLLAAESSALKKYKTQIIYPEMEEEFYPEHELTDEEVERLSEEELAKRLDEISAEHAKKQEEINNKKQTENHEKKQKDLDALFGEGFDQHDNPPVIGAKIEREGAADKKSLGEMIDDIRSGKRNTAVSVNRGTRREGRLSSIIKRVKPSSKLYGKYKGKFEKPKNTGER